MGRDIYPGKEHVSKVSEGSQDLVKGGASGPIPPIEGVIDAFYKEGDHYRFVGKTGGGMDISVDVERGELLADISGLIILVRGEHAGIDDSRFAVHGHRGGASAELDIEPGCRFRLKFGFKR